jgi:hypothetical protein
MKETLAEYLEECSDTEDGSSTPTANSSTSFESVLNAKLSSLSESELKILVGNIGSNEHLKSLFDSALKTARAVREDSHDAIMDDSDVVIDSGHIKRVKTSVGFHGRKWRELARFIPLRLSTGERRILAILDRTLKVSEYTDNVDLYISRRDRMEIIKNEIAKIESVLSGQFIAMKMTRSTDTLTENWFKEAFEIGRRYKAMNPDRLRETYVKLMYMLQDSRSVGEYCEWSQEPMKTVATALDKMGIDKEDFLSDSLLDEYVYNNNKTAIDQLVDKHLKLPYSREEIEVVVYSVKDYFHLINSFIDPINELLESLKENFDQKSDKVERIDPRLTSLSIQAGVNGSRLSHSHSRQYQYVFQSLRLWREVLMYFMPIWLKAEDDLLGGNYRLADTGQGLNRVQSAPNCSKLMNQILEKVQRDLEGNWIGSSVVHMGDHTVPNALMFLDKYCQIPRILGPIAHTLKQLEKEYNENLPPKVKEYIDSTFGGVENARRHIIVDFFRHGFDGSGADNAYDAGSCIDGRLTSSWNWCSKIEKKSFFPLFLLTNFTGFDGQHGW